MPDIEICGDQEIPLEKRWYYLIKWHSFPPRIELHWGQDSYVLPNGYYAAYGSGHYDVYNIPMN